MKKTMKDIHTLLVSNEHFRQQAEVLNDSQLKEQFMNAYSLKQAVLLLEMAALIDQPKETFIQKLVKKIGL